MVESGSLNGPLGITFNNGLGTWDPLKSDETAMNLISHGFFIEPPLSFHRPGQQTLSLLAKNLRLSLLRELAFALALTESSQPEWRRFAEQHFKQKTNELVDKLNAGENTQHKVSQSTNFLSSIHTTSTVVLDF